MAREINLVPDIKNEMIKTLKLRNYIFFACIVIAAASFGVTLIFGLIMGGQRIAVESKKNTLDELSNRLNSYTDLSDFLTIKNQVGSIDQLSDNKKVLSRTFNILSALLPSGADRITVSELTVNLNTDAPYFSLEAQANAGQEPFIDYNVLDAFKKSMKYMRYDYGKYVDKEGNEIPAYCMIESGADGATFNEIRDGKDNYYAYWTIEGDGCNPSEKLTLKDYESSAEQYEGQEVVRIWRTPQYDEWYKDKESDKQPYMSLDGEIKNVAHFESQCIKYSGNKNNGSIKWDDANDSCLLIDADESSEDPDSSGITILESSNGRDSSSELVLRFSANITLNPEVFKFANTHMLAMAPKGHRNVTDSYVQIQAMFGERASDCEEGDTACNAENAKGKK